MSAFMKKPYLTSFQIILLGFLAVILTGTGLLMLPVASREGGTAFSDALFTATSAVCVTGLVVRDTATYWSGFGKVVILLLIQIGGLGVVTTATVFSTLSGRRISLRQRSVMQDSVSDAQVGGIVRFTLFILTVTLCAEGAGTLLLLPGFAREFGVLKGLWMSVFHAVSAFCNAGFDLMGEKGAFSSLTSYAGSAWVNAVVMLLIVVGGIGFRTLEDVGAHGLRLRRCRLQSKLILAVSGALILVPALLFYLFEYPALPTGERVLAALFQSVTTRTAGFNTKDFAALSQPGRMMTVFLMLIGGSPGSTAGGMKTTTIAVLIVSAVSVFRRRECASVFGRRLPAETVRSAAAILAAYLTLFLTAAALISRIETLPLGDTLFEAASAIGTVGLTTGITPRLGTVSRLLLIFLMYFGRVGGLTLIFAALPAGERGGKYPEEQVAVG